MNGPKYLYTSLPKYFVLPSILCTPKFALLDLWKFTKYLYTSLQN